MEEMREGRHWCGLDRRRGPAGLGLAGEDQGVRAGGGLRRAPCLAQQCGSWRGERPPAGLLQSLVRDRVGRGGEPGTPWRADAETWE